MPITGGGLISSALGRGPGGGGSAGVTLLEGLSGIIDLDSSNSSIEITVSGQVINLSTIFTSTSGALLEQKCRDIDILSGLITGQNVNMGISLDFTPASGTEFVMQHDLCTEKFLWDMWTTETIPDCIVRPENVVASGKNYVTIQLDTPMSGFINLIGIGV